MKPDSTPLSPTLETQRLTLRPLAMSDAESILHYSQKPVFYQAMGRKTCSSVTDIQEFVSDILKKDPPLYWVVILKENNRLIGDCGFWQCHKEARRAEISYAVDPTYWDCGYATEAIRRVIQFGFEETDMGRIQAICSTKNIVSERVLQKAAMRLEGILGHYIRHEDKPLDMKMYSILKQEWMERQK